MRYILAEIKKKLYANSLTDQYPIYGRQLQKNLLTTFFIKTIKSKIKIIKNLIKILFDSKKVKLKY